MSQVDIERTYQAAMDAGHEAAWEMNWEKAAEAYRRALEAKPDDYLALISLGLALYSLGEWEEAAKVYRKAAEVQPREGLPWERLADIYDALGDTKAAAEAAFRAAERYARQKQLDKAVFNWERVVEWIPAHLQAHHLLALAYEHLKRPHEAIVEYLYAAAILQRLKKLDEALRLLQRAERLAPQHPDVRRALRALHRGRPIPVPKRTPRATLSRKQAAPVVEHEEEKATPLRSPVDEAADKALSALAELAFVQAEEGQQEMAASRHRLSRLTESLRGSLMEMSHRDTLLLLLAHVVEAQTKEDWEAAAAELERVVASGLQHPAVYYDLGWLYAKTGKARKALRYLQRAMNHPEFAMAAHLLMAQLFYQAGKLKEAFLESLAALRSLDLQSVTQEHLAATMEAYYESVQNTWLKRGSKDWKRFYENVQALLNSPDWRQKVQALREQGRGDALTDEVLPIVDFLMDVETPKSLEDMREIRALMREGHLDAAMEAAHFALFTSPSFLPLHMLIGDILWEMGLLEQATEKFFTLARVYVMRGEPQQAVKILRRILQIHPLHTEAHTMLIHLLSAQGRYDEVVDAYLKLGQVYRQLANLDAAVKTLEEALEMARRTGIPAEKRLLLMKALAQLAVERLDWNRAAQLYRRMAELRPNDISIILEWVDLLLRSGNIDEAVDVLENFLRQMDRAPETLQKVRFMLKKLQENHPDVPEIAQHLGMVEAALGNVEDAVKALDRAGELYLERENLLAARRIIKTILKLNPPQAPQYRELLRQLEAAHKSSS